AGEYCSTRARALALMLPPGTAAGTRPRARLVAGLTPAGAAALDGRDEVRLTPGQRELLERLRDDGPLPASAAQAALRRLEGRGLVAFERRVVGRRPTHTAVGARRTGPVRLEPAQAAALGQIGAAVAAGEHRALLLH